MSGPARGSPKGAPLTSSDWPPKPKNHNVTQDPQPAETETPGSPTEAKQAWPPTPKPQEGERPAFQPFVRSRASEGRNTNSLNNSQKENPVVRTATFRTAEPQKSATNIEAFLKTNNPRDRDHNSLSSSSNPSPTTTTTPTPTSTPPVEAPPKPIPLGFQSSAPPSQSLPSSPQAKPFQLDSFMKTNNPRETPPPKPQPPPSIVFQERLSMDSTETSPHSSAHFPTSPEHESAPSSSFAKEEKSSKWKEKFSFKDISVPAWSTKSSDDANLRTSHLRRGPASGDANVRQEQIRKEFGAMSVQIQELVNEIDRDCETAKQNRVQAVSASTGDGKEKVVVSKTKVFGPEQQEKRAHIVKEIAASEASYLKQLQSAIDDYFVPIQQAPKDPSINMSSLNSLFSTLQTLIPLNQKLLAEIKAKVDNWSPTQTVGEVFKVFGPFLKLYTAYSNNYDLARDKVQEIASQEWFIKICPAAVQLESLLIAPVQRIPRYTLLLTELLENTAPDHPDSQNLTTALGLMKTVANHVNFQISQTKNLDRVQAEGLLFLLDRTRSLLIDDILQVNTEKSKLLRENNKQKFFLFNDILVRVYPQSSQKKQKEPRDVESTSLELVWIKKEPAGANTIEICTPTSKLILGCANADIFSKWWSALTDTIEKCLKTSQPHVTNPEYTLAVRKGMHVFEDRTYEGWWRNGKPHGKGKMIVDASVFKGNFIDGQIEGLGVMTFPDGHTYTGNFLNGWRHGIGELEISKENYLGEWELGKRSGFGEMIYSNGERYQGQWDKDNRHGQGTLTMDSNSYTGNWHTGMYHGEGTLTLPSGVYIGNFVNGLRAGAGTFKAPKGEVYEGNWKHGVYHGHGKMTTKAGVYEGEWYYGFKKGKGIMNYTEGAKYEGHWLDDKRHGSGVCEYANGYVVRYDGEWIKDRKNGKGKQLHADGSIYDGNFVEDQMHGTGSLTHDNIQIDGKWVRGVREGKASLTIRQGNQKVTQYLDPLETITDEPWEQNFIPNIFCGLNS